MRKVMINIYDQKTKQNTWATMSLIDLQDFVLKSLELGRCGFKSTKGIKIEHKEMWKEYSMNKGLMNKFHYGSILKDVPDKFLENEKLLDEVYGMPVAIKLNKAEEEEIGKFIGESMKVRKLSKKKNNAEETNER